MNGSMDPEYWAEQLESVVAERGALGPEPPRWKFWTNRMPWIRADLALGVACVFVEHVAIPSADGATKARLSSLLSEARRITELPK